MIAFSGEARYKGETYTEAKINEFPSAKIEKEFRKDPYRILVVADKFQTGYDEPLLQTMYVDKKLFDIKAVQTLSRLNRCAQYKTDTFVLDFINNPADIQKSFELYYKTTVLSGETDANKLNDLVDNMEPMQVYTDEDVDTFVELYLNNADREQLDPIIDKCVELFKELEYDDKVEFKKSAKAFVRTYTAYQGDTRSRRNQTFLDWLLDLIFNAAYEKPSSSAPGGTGYRYPEYELPLSMVAEDTIPYNAENDD